MNYYNEFNPESAAMLRQMVADGLLPPAIVDERPIQEVQPDELKQYTQCHFFAGIGGWSYALQLAEWPADKPVWTGSCPCQPFSTAGRQKGKADDRHLWPEWLRLIKECRPATIFGEQVSSAIAHGWLDDVYQGLEAQGYAVGSAVLPACSVGAPHKRDRLWFVANAESEQTQWEGQGGFQSEPAQSGIMGNAEHNGHATPSQQGSDGASVQHHSQGQDSTSQLAGAGSPSNVANREQQGLEGYGRPKQGNGKEGWETAERHPWAAGVWIDCPDGKQRLIEPSICLLADGVQHRKPILHALGNAIVPQVGAAFIKATKGITY